ncbi:MAG TPA: hypothetical protein VLI93_02250 [Acetobacteraceae bacterium]|nr:hypothetical protein [Acetobacteraceae bacterium]
MPYPTRRSLLADPRPDRGDDISVDTRKLCVFDPVTERLIA